jgi:transcriptional regulator with GAF, ATPase, and Fis domain
MREDGSLDEALESAMDELTAAFSEPIDVEQTLTRVTAAAVHLVDGADYADVMLIDKGEFRSVAPTDPLVGDLDRVQMDHQRGPCLEATTDNSVVRSPDLGQDTRWPEFAASAARFGVHSVASFQLFTHRHGSGALNVLSKRSHAFDVHAEAALAMLATHAAITLIAADRQTQFESALASRDVIGQAKGIVMERYKLDASRAFATLVKLSQDTNTPVRVVAQRLVASIIE